MDLNKRLTGLPFIKKKLGNGEDDNADYHSSNDDLTSLEPRARVGSSVYNSRYKSRVPTQDVNEALKQRSRSIIVSTKARNTRGISLYNQAAMRQQQQQNLLFQPSADAPHIPAMPDLSSHEYDNKLDHDSQSVHTSSTQEYADPFEKLESSESSSPSLPKSLPASSSAESSPRAFSPSNVFSPSHVFSPVSSLSERSHAIHQELEDEEFYNLSAESSEAVDQFPGSDVESSYCGSLESVDSSVLRSATSNTYSSSTFHDISIAPTVTEETLEETRLKQYFTNVSQPSFDEKSELSLAVTPHPTMKVPPQPVEEAQSDNFKSNAVPMIYLAKCALFNIVLFAMVMYLNNYNIKCGILFNSKKEELIYTMVTFGYEHVFLIFLAVVAVLTANNLAIICSFGFNLVISAIELGYYGHQMQLLYYQNASATLKTMSLVSLSSSGQISKELSDQREKILSKIVLENPRPFYTVIILFLSLSIVSEVLIYFLGLAKINARRIYVSASLKTLKRIEAAQLEEAAVFVNTASMPLLFVNFVYKSASESLFYLSVFSLFCVIALQAFHFAPLLPTQKLQNIANIASLAMIIFNCFVQVSSLSMLIISTETIGAIASFVICIFFFPANFYMAACIAKKEIRQTESFYDQIDARFLVGRIKHYRTVLLGLCMLVTGIFNFIFLGVYASLNLSYQWLCVTACLNLALLPILFTSLDLNGVNYHGYTAIIALMFLQCCCFIFGYTSIWAQLNNVSDNLNSQVGEFFAVIIYSAACMIISYFYISLGKVHYVYTNFLKNSAKMKREPDATKQFEMILGPWIHVRCYLTFISMCLILNYNLNNSKYLGDQSSVLPSLAIIAGFFQLLVSRSCTKVALSKMMNVICTSCLVLLSIFLWIAQMYLVTINAQSLKYFTYGVQNVELRFHIGIGILASLGLTVEMALEVLILWDLKGSEIRNRR